MPLYVPSLPLAGGTMTGTITNATGTIVASTPALVVRQTWNNAAVAFQTIDVDITETANAGGAMMLRLAKDGVNQFTVDYYGTVRVTQSLLASGLVAAAGSQWALSSGGYWFRLGSAGVISWSSTGQYSGTNDIGIVRNAAGVLEVNSGTAGTYRDTIARASYVAPSSANGQSLGIKCLTELTTIAAAATTDTTIQMPAGAIVLGVQVRNTVAVTCTTSYAVGDSGNASRFSAAIAKAVNTTASLLVAPYLNASALSVRITPDTTPSDATGRVRVTIYYWQATDTTS